MNANTKYEQISTTEAARRSGTVYRCSGNLFVCKTTSCTVPFNFVNSCRGRVVGLTAGSATRMRRYLRSCVAHYHNMVTLTYPGFYESDGAITKEHLRRFLQELKRKTERDGNPEGYSSFWFLEFQARGAPHFHIFTTHDFPKQFISTVWYGIVNSEDPRHLAAGTRIERLQAGRSGTVSYASKYASKEAQKDVPDGYTNVGRFWGVSGQRGIVSADTFVSRDDRRSEGIRHSEKGLGNAINTMINDGKAVLYKREHGVAIYILMTADATKKIMLRISILSAKTQRYPQIFQDADINIEGY